MSRSVRLTLADIAESGNLHVALHRACRGKWSRPDVQQMLIAPQAPMQQLRAALQCGELPHGRFDSFTIYDPKKRLIHAAPLLDRVAHHAMMNCMEARLEQALLPSVFACRAGKGVHAAISYAQRQSRRSAWVMHADIRHYFPAIQHSALRKQLQRRFRGDGLQLVESVLAAYCPVDGVMGRGLPIGALTSQHLANHYLSDIDRWCLAQPGVRAHCRYMDDLLLWADEKYRLLELRDALQHRLADTLGLSLKPVSIQRTSVGVQFCGIKIKPYTLRASKRRRKRFKAAFNTLEHRWHNHQMDSLAVQRGADAAMTILLPASEKTFRRHCFNNRPVLEV